MIPDPITTTEAAAILGVTRRHVWHLIKIGELPAERWGRDFILSNKVVRKYKPKPPGRPKST
jgi:excisionase family DNA binding protein